jgi:hypothetical protein
MMILPLYSNSVNVNSSRSDFSLLFMYGPSNKPMAVACVVLTPETAKRLRNALTEVIDKYEHRFGVIRDGGSGIVVPKMAEGT